MKRFFWLTFILWCCGIAGCGEGSIELAQSDMETSRSLCQEITNFKESLKVLDDLTIQKWSIDEQLSNAFQTVTNEAGRIRLLNDAELEISDMPYADLDARRCQVLYPVVARAFSAIQDAYWSDAKAPDMAVESWFSEINHFEKEIERCKVEAARNEHVSKPIAEEFIDRILVCKSECEKTYYKIDIKGFMGESFCKRLPKHKGKFLERVRKLIGRYPEWYSNDDIIVPDGNH